MSLVLHYAPWSSATTSVWALEELGIPYEKKKLDLAAKDTHTPEFLALNPNGMVPLLVHDGAAIFESIAILAYLGETFGVEKKLFPAAGPERGQALQWLAWANVSLGATVGTFMNNTADHIPADLRNAKAGANAKARVTKLLGILDAHLAGRTWMVGDSFTFADLQLAGALSWITRLGFATKDHPNLDAWLPRCTGRPAFKAAMSA